MRTMLRRGLTAGTLMVSVALPLAVAFAAPASAQPSLNNGGPVSLVTTGTVTSGTPYSSGQSVNIQVTANSTLSLANLETFGFTGEPSIKVVECSDLDGTTANLPVTPTNNCDGSTIDSTTAINSDGSLQLTGFTIYALPDVNLGESSSSLPACGIAPDYCVLYVGPDQNDFADPHLFSAPFQVTANGTDSGANPGDGTPESPLTIGLPLLGLGVVGGTVYLRRRRQTPGQAQAS